MEPVYSFAETLVRPILDLWFEWDIEGTEIADSGPRIIAANHPSYVDPFAYAYFHHVMKRRARFLAKAELFRNPVLGWILSRMGQIPVYRGTSDAVSSLRAAEEALDRGESVVVFVESTIGPGLPLLPPKTGAARLALATGAPVATVATWGGQEFWTKRRPKDLARGKTISVIGGSLDTYSGDVNDREAVAATAEQIHARLSKLVEETAARPQHS